jgi:hypothetical protein
LSFFEPLTAFVFSFVFLGVLVYKRVGLGVTLTLTALVFSLLSLESGSVVHVFYKTLTDRVTISLVLATFGVMLLSLLYRETGLVALLSQSLSQIVRNSKLVVSMLPAVIGLLPVPGGALMSAPMVESQAKKLNLAKSREAYINIWFRHAIFPVYPMSQVLILTAALTGLPLLSIIIRQMPVVIAMVVIGYLIGFRKTSRVRGEVFKNGFHSSLSSLLKAFAPILAMIFAVALFGVDVSIAAFLGVIILLLIVKPGLSALSVPFKGKTIYQVTLAALGAMLLRNVTVASGVSETLGSLVAGGSISHVVLLSTLPMILAFLLGSPSGGVALSVSMLAGTLSFEPKTAGLLYITTYLGYLGAPTHLCLALTVDYFKSSLDEVYKYMIPSLVLTFLVAVLGYFFF